MGLHALGIAGYGSEQGGNGARGTEEGGKGGGAALEHRGAQWEVGGCGGEQGCGLGSRWVEVGSR